MGFVEAFKALGYSVDAPRADWSAACETGVCLALWQKEIKHERASSQFDSRVDADPIENWGMKPGNIKRMKHLEFALAKFDGQLDVIIVSGVPGVGFGDADPWFPEKRKNNIWNVTFFNPQTGHFKVQTSLRR